MEHQITTTDKYGNLTLKTKRIRAGVYEYVDYQGRKWIMQESPWQEFSECVREWWLGEEDDPGASQYPTLWQCKEALAKFLNEGL